MSGPLFVINRDKNGRFISTPQAFIPLSEEVKNCIIGQLLGDVI